MEISFPVVFFSQARGSQIALTAWDIWELETSFLHKYIGGQSRAIRIIDSKGRCHLASSQGFPSIDWRTFREFGFFITFISAIISIFNFPIRMNYSYSAGNSYELEYLRKELLDVIKSNSDLYTRKNTIEHVLKKTASAKNFKDLILAISNNG